MKKHTWLIVLMLAGLSLTSCNNNNTPESLTKDDFQKVKVNKQYSLNVPKYMKKSDELNKEASLQYQSLEKNAYVIVFGEDKTLLKKLPGYKKSLSVAKNYRNYQQAQLAKGVNITKKIAERSIKINGLPAELVHFDGKINTPKAEVAYFLTYIEGKTKVYQVMAWTPKSRRKKYAATFDQIIKSFKEL